MAALSNADRMVRNLRNKTSFRGYTAADFSGSFASDKAFSKKRWNNGQLDIFKEAANAPKSNKDPRNNWLGGDSKPVMDVFPDAVGLHIGNFGFLSGQIVSLLTEHAQLVIEQESSVILRQPLLTIPSGMGYSRSIAAAPQQETPEVLVSESFGPLVPTGLFQLASNTVFETTKILKAYLQVEDEVLDHLRGITEELPAYGARIGIVVYGTAEYRVGATL